MYQWYALTQKNIFTYVILGFLFMLF